MTGDVWAKVDRELWVVTATAGPRRGGLIATFVSQASIVPAMPRVLIGIARRHHTWELIQESGAFALHLFDEAHAGWVWQFANGSGCDRDKLAGLALTTAATGTPLLADAVAWLDCRVEATLDTGDRTIYLAQTLAASVQGDKPALTMKRYLQIAPTEHLAELKRQFDSDARADADAITRWRSEQ